MKRHSRIPWKDFLDGQDCGECVHGTGYIPVLADSRRGGTVLCRKHRCRVWALGGSCKDYVQAKEVK